VEIALEQEADDFLYESPGFTVASNRAVSEDALVSVSKLPESIKLLRECLSVRVCLENVIRTILDGI